MPTASSCFVLLLGAATIASGCDGCSRRETKRAVERSEVEAPRAAACSVATDCADDDPCTTHECVDEHCVAKLATRGTACDNDTVCDGVGVCDANGRCVAGPPPLVDDGNACTLDSCDPRRGVVHEAIPIDDSDACTTDSCDPATGQIAHATLSVDDGNDCTVDSCDPRLGPKHEQPNGKYTCQVACEPGFHVASRTRDPQCGSAEALRSYCAPNCGVSFHTCDPGCPRGYVQRASSPGGSCGASPSVMLFCAKE